METMRFSSGIIFKHRRVMMAKITEWESQYNGQTYTFSHEKVKGKRILKVNGEATEIKPGFWSFLLSLDEPFTFEGKEARFVEIGGEFDIAVDGILLKSGKPYVKQPKWIVAFFVPLIPLFINSGVVGAIGAIVGAAALQAVGRKLLPVLIKVLISIGIVVATWIVVIVIALTIAGGWQ